MHGIGDALTHCARALTLGTTALVACTLAACGGRSLNPGVFESSAGTGGALAAQGGVSGSSAGNAAGSRDPGGAGYTAAGAGPSAPPTAQIAGRWALFAFADPVGVQLTQTGGTLGGDGCSVGAPPADGTQDCGAVTGMVDGQHASFGFHPGTAVDYLADVTVSGNGQRMTGRFHGTAMWMDYPTAWLRLPDGELWLETKSIAQPAEGRYDLRLTKADDGGDEFTATTVYRLSYFYTGINSDLGSFHHSEMKRIAPGGTIRVGPVPMTSLELAVQLDIDGIDDAFTEIAAITGSGHHYRFALKRAVN